jgi:hypothetical protein
MAAKIPAGLDQQLARIALEGGKHWGASDQARYDKLVRERGASRPSSRSSGSSSSNNGQGMFKFQGMMNDFYKSSPNDDAGRMAKNAFKGNFIQSAVDSQLAMQLGQFNSGLAQNNMTHQADLELRNQSAAMKDEFNYGMQSMDAQFKYQNQFANAQHDRDLGMVSATGEQDRLSIGAQGQQDRLGTIVIGEQQRLTDAQNNASNEKINFGSFDKDRDVANIGAKAKTDVGQMQKDSSLYESDANTVQQLISSDAEKFKATSAADASKYGADRTVDVASVNAQGTIDNTRATGDETRKTQDNETRLKAKDRANMHSYARNTARAF